MPSENLSERDFSNEFVINTSRSSGPGGQNVNKVNSKVELRFNVIQSQLLTEDEKLILRDKLKSKITDAGELLIVSQINRSQLMNRESAIEKFYQLLEKALAPEKPRKPTKPSRAAKEKRLEKKKINSIKKEFRKNINP